MKIGELRKKLAELTNEEVIKVASEFYKLIPKDKKEQNDVDSFVNDPASINKKKSKSTPAIPLDEIAIQVKIFISNAKDGYYFRPNRIIPKKERQNWRFSVKNWYKDLSDINREDKDLKLQANLLAELFDILCESESYAIFRSMDTFNSLKVSKGEFYSSIVLLMQEGYGKGGSLEKLIKLITNINNVYYFSDADYFDILVKTLDIPDLKYKAIDITKHLITEKKTLAESVLKKKSYGYDLEYNDINDQINFLAVAGYKLYSSLFELENAVGFFKKYFKEQDEQKLFYLVFLLFGDRQKDLVKNELDMAVKKKLRVRKSLLELKDYIKKNNELPEKFYY